MNRSRYKTKIMIAFCCLTFLFYGCAKQITSTEISNATINYTYNSHGFIVIPLGDGAYILIDTGATGSLIFSDRKKIDSKPIIGQGVINQVDTFPIKRKNIFQIGDLVIKNHNFVFAKAKNTVFNKETAIVGVIGMDILSQKHTFFDLKNQTITFSDKRNVQCTPPSLIFSYELPNRPYFNLCVNGIVFENVLFDTGFNCFLTLLEKDKAKLNSQNHLQQTSNIDFFNNQRTIYSGQFNSIQINDISFYNQMYSFGARTRLLGMGFVRQFSSFLIDPFERKIMFFE